MELSGHNSNPCGPLEALLDGANCDTGALSGATYNDRICDPGAPGEAVRAVHPRQGRIIGGVPHVLKEKRRAHAGS